MRQLFKHYDLLLTEFSGKLEETLHPTIPELAELLRYFFFSRNLGK